MKTTMILLTVLLAVCFTQAIPVKALSPATAGNASGNGENWKKARNNAWPGVVNEQTYWYRLDKSARLLWSPDGKKWEQDSDGMWADKEGSFYKIEGGKLISSVDGGNAWNDTPEWKWMAVDGNWYKVDKDWIVWVKK